MAAFRASRSALLISSLVLLTRLHEILPDSSSNPVISYTSNDRRGETESSSVSVSKSDVARSSRSAKSSRSVYSRSNDEAKGVERHSEKEDESFAIESSKRSSDPSSSETGQDSDDDSATESSSSSWENTEDEQNFMMAMKRGYEWQVELEDELEQEALGPVENITMIGLEVDCSRVTNEELEEGLYISEDRWKRFLQHARLFNRYLRMNPTEGRQDLDNSYRTFLRQNEEAFTSRRHKKASRRKKVHRKRPEYKEYESDSWLVSSVDEEEDIERPWMNFKGAQGGVKQGQQKKMSKRTKKLLRASERKASMTPIPSSNMIKNADKYSKKYLMKHLRKDFSQTPTPKKKLFKDLGSARPGTKRHNPIASVQINPQGGPKNLSIENQLSSNEVKKPRREMQTSLDSFSLYRHKAPAAPGTFMVPNCSGAEVEVSRSSKLDTSQSSEGERAAGQGERSAPGAAPLPGSFDTFNITWPNVNCSLLPHNSSSASHPSIAPVQIRLYDWARNKLLKGLPVVAKEPTSSQSYDVELKDGAIVSKGGQIMVRGVSTDLRSWDLFSPSKKDCNETDGSVFEGVTREVNESDHEL
ncbi:hypothetical protein GUITHDRAFT_109751 [Guillardia theta CCMP2712]|uniref:Uncharacterized protein n=1 Tax=Guillardia theta (strain CCMP2712) TaxID=905079 RepID=L1J713_GUITC|nr:hypothetical protein GUITHDRAFT_109751 [Guillardia theta CCMP2712]EKX44296.1 hypothetical protein GUITHDRAFT_109751 [Guillardia theta CCMP2712]|eukprot:XP_005831276.1 hypothetical protein GUITHDRAFT_109751 [Guillardia theta CCMP2712]